jgi:hypothetical protein
MSNKKEYEFGDYTRATLRFWFEKPGFLMLFLRWTWYMLPFIILSNFLVTFWGKYAWYPLVSIPMFIINCIYAVRKVKNK